MISKTSYFGEGDLECFFFFLCLGVGEIDRKLDLSYFQDFFFLDRERDLLSFLLFIGDIG
jgi:hypothetical protein